MCHFKVLYLLSHPAIDGIGDRALQNRPSRPNLHHFLCNSGSGPPRPRARDRRSPGQSIPESALRAHFAPRTHPAPLRSTSPTATARPLSQNIFTQVPSELSLFIRGRDLGVPFPSPVNCRRGSYPAWPIRATLRDHACAHILINTG
jgi:hypothetical protein